VEAEETASGVSKKEFDKLSGDVKDIKKMIKEIADGKYNSKESA
jgi:hypothetical protein